MGEGERRGDADENSWWINTPTPPRARGSSRSVCSAPLRSARLGSARLGHVVGHPSPRRSRFFPSPPTLPSPTAPRKLRDRPRRGKRLTTPYVARFSSSPFSRLSSDVIIKLFFSFPSLPLHFLQSYFMRDVYCCRYRKIPPDSFFFLDLRERCRSERNGLEKRAIYRVRVFPCDLPSNDTCLLKCHFLRRNLFEMRFGVGSISFSSMNKLY